MKYLCLIYQDAAVIQNLPKAELEKFRGEYLSFTDGIRQSGHHVGNHGLEPARTATVVRVRDGKIATTDGPF
ncbi:MAG TPA: YciI family protein, partial [Candidatus Binatia bacterium]|nr:YciI family protein [Candidatus Binatia bacterium]